MMIISSYRRKISTFTFKDKNCQKWKKEETKTGLTLLQLILILSVGNPVLIILDFSRPSIFSLFLSLNARTGLSECQ